MTCDKCGLDLETVPGCGSNVCHGEPIPEIEIHDTIWDRLLELGQLLLTRTKL